MLDPLPAAWRDFRWRQATVAAALVAGVPLHLVGAALDRLATSTVPHRLLVSAWATGSAAAVLWFFSFRCPFCRAPFHFTWWVSNPFARACLHCGFRKWKDPAAASRLRPPPA